MRLPSAAVGVVAAVLYCLLAADTLNAFRSSQPKPFYRPLLLSKSVIRFQSKVTLRSSKQDDDDPFEKVRAEAEDALKAAETALQQKKAPPSRVDPEVARAAQVRNKAVQDLQQDAIASAIGGAVIGATLGGIVVVGGTLDSSDIPAIVPPLVAAMALGGGAFAGANRDSRVGRITRNILGKPTKAIGKFLAKAVKNALDGALESIKAIPGKIADALQAQADKASREVQALPSKLQEAARSKVNEAAEELKTIPKKLQFAAQKKAEEAIDEIQKIPTKVAESTKRAADELAQEIKATPGRVAASTKKAVERAVDEVVALPAKTLDDLEQKISSVLEGGDSERPKPPIAPPPPPPPEQTIQQEVSPPKKLDLPSFEPPKLELPSFEVPKIDFPKIPDLKSASPSAPKPPSPPKEDGFVFSEVSLQNFLKKDDVSEARAEAAKELAAAEKRKEQESRIKAAKAAAAQKLKEQEARARAAEAAAEERRRQEEERARKAAAESAKAAQKLKQEREQAAEASAAQKLKQERDQAAQAAAAKRKEAEATALAERQRREAESVKMAAVEQRRKDAEAKKAAAAAKQAAAESRRQAMEAKKEAAEAKLRERAAAAAKKRAEAERKAEERKKATVVPTPSASLRVTPVSEPPRKVQVSKAPRGVPTIVKWRRRLDGGITGMIYGSPNFDDGERVETTKIASGSIENGSVVVTGSGSRYFLSDTAPKMTSENKKALLSLLSAIPGSTITLTRESKEKEAQQPQDTSSQPRATFSLFGKEIKPAPVPVPSKNAKRPVRVAPRGVPTLKRWKQNRDGSITAFISGSPSFNDGARVTTSPIAIGTCAPGEIVKTGSGSRYFLE